MGGYQRDYYGTSMPLQSFPPRSHSDLVHSVTASRIKTQLAGESLWNDGLASAFLFCFFYWAS